MQDIISIIGPLNIDILAGPVSEDIFSCTSMPMEHIKLSFGGDALNESVVLSRLGKKVDLTSKVGCDAAGEQVIGFLHNNGILTDNIISDSTTETGINVVLTDKDGERHFLTNPNGALRKLSEEDVQNTLDNLPREGIVSFASMFVSPLLDTEAMERIFKRIKDSSKRKLVVDMTNPKKGETISDIEKLLPYIDVFMPNETEAEALTGSSDVYENAEKFIDAGAKCVVIKRGKAGCLLRYDDKCVDISAYKGVEQIDSTGAGDSFAAGMIWALSEEMNIEECARFACALASCSVECVGATDGIVSVEEPYRRYEEMKR